MNNYWSGGYEENVFVCPEACGLEIEFVRSNTDEPYRFDYTVVFRDIATGKLFLGEDSGCSCPIPFENVHSLADLTPIKSHTLKRLSLGEK